MKSIPAGLPISEASRLLAYLKVKFQPGYFSKSKLKAVSLSYGIDKRTVKKLLDSLAKDMLLGQDEKAYYLRSWRFITEKEGFNSQAFKASLSEIKSKKKFECLLFGAKITSIQKAIRKGQVRNRGFTDQSPSSGFLSKACKISQGKVTKLKRLAAEEGLIIVNRNFEDHGQGTIQVAKILKSELPGIFYSNGRIKRRKADQIVSSVQTFRIKSRRVWSASPRRTIKDCKRTLKTHKKQEC